jgi:hypothetical protein
MAFRLFVLVNFVDAGGTASLLQGCADARGGANFVGAGMPTDVGAGVSASPMRGCATRAGMSTSLTHGSGGAGMC